jgi:hypothetical protein
MHKLSMSFCVGDFYLVGKIDIDNLMITKDDKEGYSITFAIDHNDIKRIDDPELKNTEMEAKSNVIQIDFNTGEKKWV